MPTLNTESDLLEVKFTPEELHRAMQLCDTNLSIQYLQNTAVAIFRRLALQESPTTLEDRQRFELERAHLQGQLFTIQAIIAGALEPTPVPTANEEQSSISSQPFSNQE